MDLLSCDNFHDAIESLAIIYSTTPENIKTSTAGLWPEYIEEGGFSNQELLPHLMGLHICSTPNYDLNFAAYYHRTMYSGDWHWFDEGLLASTSGTKAFLNKISSAFAVEKFSNAVIQNAERREMMQNDGGPYAFDIFDDAKFAEHYGVPEFFIGQDGRYLVDEQFLSKLNDFLKPVVVKFSGEISSPEGYIAGLWHYVYRVQNDDEPTRHNPLTHTFAGNGKDVPRCRIIDLIDI
jgi:hypothetical protein